MLENLFLRKLVWFVGFESAGIFPSLLFYGIPEEMFLSIQPNG
jgi:hypothetical protein